jgi:hypothetical protein
VLGQKMAVKRRDIAQLQLVLMNLADKTLLNNNASKKTLLTYSYTPILINNNTVNKNSSHLN